VQTNWRSFFWITRSTCEEIEYFFLVEILYELEKHHFSNARAKQHSTQLTRLPQRKKSRGEGT